MAEVIYKVQAPDGSILRIAGPEGASESEIEAFAAQTYAKKSSGEGNQVDRLPILQSEYVNAVKQMQAAENIADTAPTEANVKAYERASRDVSALRSEITRLAGEDSIPDVSIANTAPAPQPSKEMQGPDLQAQKSRIAADLLGAAGGAGIAKSTEMIQHGAQAANAVRQLPTLLQGLSGSSTGPSGASSGAKWLQNWGGIAKEGFEGGVPEAAGQYNKMKPNPKSEIMSSLAKRGLIKPQPVQPGVFTGGQLSIQSRPPVVPPPAPAGPLSQAAGFGKKALGVVANSPILSGALGGVSAMESGREFMNRLNDKDIPGMMISGAGAAGGALQMIPHPATRGVGAALSTASPLTMYLYDKLRAKNTQPPTPEELRAANHPAFVFPKP